MAGALLATLSRIAAERAPDPAGPPDDPDAMVTAVLDVLAPVIGMPFQGEAPFFPPVRVPVFLVDHNGQAVVPAVEGVRAMAEQIVTAIRTASGPSPLESAARYFTDVCGELAADLPDSYGCTLNCAEARAIAYLFAACDRQDRADAVMAAHAAHDQPGDDHYRPPGDPA